jgi:6-phosphogluconolactonase
MNPTHKTVSLLRTLAFGMLLFSLGTASMWADVIYTQTNASTGNGIAAFAQNPETGELTLKNVFPTNGVGNPGLIGFSQDSIVTDGQFLFAVNAGSNDISVFKIERGGDLKLIGNPVSSGGVAPITLALFEDALYVANQGDGSSIPANLTGFRVRENGELTQIAESTITLAVGAVPTDVKFSPDGKVLVLSRLGDNMVQTFKVSQEGLLTNVATLTGQSGAFGMEFNPTSSHNLIGTQINLHALSSYSVGEDGSISTLSTTIDTASVDSCWVAIIRDGRFVFFSGFFGQSVALLQINPDKSLAAVGLHDTSVFGQFASDIVLDTAQHFLYEVQPGSARIHVMKVTLGDLAAGGLADTQTVALPPQSAPIGLVSVRTLD